MRDILRFMPMLPAILLCGCMSAYRPGFDISPSGVRSSVLRIDDGPYVVVEIRRFFLREFACNLCSRKNYACFETVPGSEIMPELSRLFPSLFADTPDAVPIIVMQNVRGGGVADAGGASMFGGAVGFNKGLSRQGKTEMAPAVPFPPYFYFNSLACVGTFGIVPFYMGSYSSHYGVSIMTGYDNYGREVRYSAEARLSISSWLYAPFMSESSGWVRADIMSKSGWTDPDATESQKLTALCCAIAKALSEMPRSARAELRRNPVALLRDKETGGLRRFRLVQVAPERDISEERIGTEPNRPRIVFQAYNTATRRGTVVFDASECDDPKAAVAWVRESYIPLVASQKSRAVDAPETEMADRPPRISVTGFKREGNSRTRIDFAVLE